MHDGLVINTIIHQFTGRPREDIVIFWPGYPWQDIAKKIQENNKGIFLLLNCDIEPDDQLPFLDQWLTENHKRCDVFFLSEDFLKSWHSCLHIKNIKFIDIHYSVLAHISFYKQFDHKLEKSFSLDNATPKWLCLNRTMRPHRVYVIEKWIENCHRDRFVYTGGQQKFSGKIDYRSNLPPQAVNMLNLISLQSLYNDTCGSVVTETCGPGYITEKIIHAIMALHPMLVVGNPGTVSYLRNQGFDMFDDLIDHSYDTVQDTYLRIDTLFRNNANIINNGLDRKALQQRLLNNRDQVWAYYKNQLDYFEDSILTHLNRP